MYLLPKYQGTEKTNALRKSPPLVSQYIAQKKKKKKDTSKLLSFLLILVPRNMKMSAPAHTGHVSKLYTTRNVMSSSIAKF